jgi:hypothetical protein
MSTFILTLDLTRHTHEHSPRAHRHLIGQMLDNAKQEVGSRESAEGKLTYPPGSDIVIGAWKILESEDVT